MPDRLAIVTGNVEKQTVDAIVNAANSSLLGGGGVDGAVHQAAGPELLEECRTLGGCAPGKAKITRGYNLPAQWIIHAVGPVWRGGEEGEDELLASCYRSCFELVETHSIKTVAFPAISTGAYAFPVDRAARIALREIEAFLQRNDTVERVIVVCYEQRVYDAYEDARDAAYGGEMREPEA
jgi:O-acetyl-ADP-ribose deacetylase (regulator of RNase III)